MYSFPWVPLANRSGCNQEFPYYPKISQYVRTLFPNTESYFTWIHYLNLDYLSESSPRYPKTNWFRVEITMFENVQRLRFKFQVLPIISSQLLVLSNSRCLLVRSNSRCLLRCLLVRANSQCLLRCLLVWSNSQCLLRCLLVRSKSWCLLNLTKDVSCSRTEKKKKKRKPTWVVLL